MATISKKNYSYDLLNNTLTITESFYKKSKVYGSPEFNKLRELLTENSGCKVEITPDTKKTYKGLTLALIREYIEIKDERETLRAEMSAVKKEALVGKENVSEKMADKLAFPLIKKWFLKKFVDFSVSRAEKEISDYKIEQAEKSVKKDNLIHMPQNQMTPAVNQ